MDETTFYPWFLGPKAENAELLEKLVLEALRDCVFWRRNFHPEDDILITEKAKREDAYERSRALIQQEFLTLLANLKRDVPFYSPRYIGHMLGEQLLPAVAAYFAAMLHNPNNVSLESSPITTQYEIEVGRQLARLMGYSDESWGHITSGGTIANFEALWVARNLKYFPIAARNVARSLNLDDLSISLPTGQVIDLAATGDNWKLLNLDTDEVLSLRSRLCIAYARRNPDLTALHVEQMIDQQLASNSISCKGILRFFTELNDDSIAPGVILIPATAHYSMQKVVEALGIGRDQIILLPVDKYFRTDIDSLRERIQRCIDGRIPIIALISVLGTTEEGAVDQLHKIVALQKEARHQGLAFYHHSDGAWGGYVKTLFYDSQDRPVTTPTAIRELTQTWPTDELFESYSSTGFTDSMTIDPHKLGYIPYPCGTIVFRNASVKDLVSTEAPYIFHDEERRDRPFIGKHILEGSKPGAAAAAAWFAHRVVPLNQSGYGALIGMSIQSTQEMCYRIGRELKPELARNGILLHMLTDPPDGNIFCFIVNKSGNRNLAEMNRINQTIYDELKFRPDSVIQHHNFIISSTSLTWQQYGMSCADGKNSMEEHLEAVGIDPGQFAEVGKIKVLRCTIMSPWLSLSRGGNPDYSAAFAEVLKKTIENK